MILETAMAGGPFKPGYQPAAVKSIPATPRSKFTDLVDLLEYCCSTVTYSQWTHKMIESMESIPQYTTLDMVLNPKEIQDFLHVSTQHEAYPSYQFVTGLITTKLIQNTHDHAQVDNFVFNMEGIKLLDYFGYKLEKRKRNLDLLIFGKVGKFAFERANCNALLEKTGHGVAQYSTGRIGTWKMYDGCETTTEYRDRHIVHFRSSRRYVEKVYVQINPEKQWIMSCYYRLRFETPHQAAFNSLRSGRHLVAPDEWIPIWKPAAKTIADMERIFGGRE